MRDIQRSVQCIFQICTRGEERLHHIYKKK